MFLFDCIFPENRTEEIRITFSVNLIPRILFQMVPFVVVLNHHIWDGHNTIIMDYAYSWLDSTNTYIDTGHVCWHGIICTHTTCVTVSGNLLILYLVF